MAWRDQRGWVVGWVCLWSCAAGCAPPPGDQVPSAGSTLAPFAPGAEVWGEAPPQVEAAPLEVLEALPQGAEFEGRQIRVRFNQPVVALQRAERLEAPGAIRLEPPVEGHAWWMTPDVLVFDAARLEPARRYEVIVEGGLEAVGGGRLAAPLRFGFTTAAPKVERMEPHDTSAVALDRPAVICFSMPVALDEVEAHLRAEASALRPGAEAAWEPLPVRLRYASEAEQRGHCYRSPGEAAVVAVPSSGGWPYAHAVRLSLSAGVKPVGGEVGTQVPYTQRFETRRPLVLESVECAPEEECASYATLLSFSNPIRKDQLRHLKVTPPVPRLELEIMGYGDEGTSVEVRGSFQPGVTYTLYVPAAIEDIYGQRLGVSTKHPLRFVKPAPLLELAARAGLVQRGGPPSLGFNARHVRSLRVRVTSPLPAEVQARVLAGLDPRKAETWRLHPSAAEPQERVLTLRPDPRSGWVSSGLELASLAPRGGLAQVEVSAAEMAPGFEAPPSDAGLFEVSGLAPWVVLSRGESLVRVVAFGDGAPVSGARVSIWGPSHPAQVVGETDASGLLPLRPEPWWTTAGTVLAVERGEELALVELSAAARKERTWPAPLEGGALRPGERLRGHLATERGLYLPGDAVALVAFTAVDSPYAERGLRQVPEGVAAELTLYDPRGRAVLTQAGRVGPGGKLWGRLPIPEDAALGTWRVEAMLEDLGSLSARVEVKKFRVPEFNVEVSAQLAELRSDFDLKFNVKSSYFFGGPVQLQQAHAVFSCWQTSPSLPGLEGWSVGAQGSWRGGRWGRSRQAVSLQAHERRQGAFVLTQPPLQGELPWTQRCSVAVEVGDASEQVVGGVAEVVRHPADAYVLVSDDPTPVRVGESRRLRVRGVDWRGRRVALDRVRVTTTRVWEEAIWLTEDGERYLDRWETREAPGPGCVVTAPASGEDGGCDLRFVKEGTYRVLAAAEVEGRSTWSEGSVEVAPRGWKPDFPALEEGEELQVVAAQLSASPGERLQVGVRSRWRDAWGVLLVHRRGVRWSYPFRLTGETATLEVRLEEDMVPEVTLEATLFLPGGRRRDEPLPRWVSAAAEVSVRSASRRLEVEVTSAPSGAPREQVPVQVSVREQGGAPVMGRVAIWAVDEAVLSLRPHPAPRLWELILPGTGVEVSAADTLEEALPPFKAVAEDPGEARWGFGYGLGGVGAGGGGMGVGGVGTAGRGGGAAPPERERFAATPLFLGDVALDAAGRASVTLELPDNISEFKLIALASASLEGSEAPGRFGVGEGRVAVRAPLVVRGALPRVLRPGDEATGRLLVNNGSGPAGTLALRAEVVEGGAHLRLAAPVSASASVEAGGQAQAPLALEALTPGVARLRLEATLTPQDGSAPRRDAVILPLEVAAEPTLIERVAMYGDTESARPLTVPLLLPDGARPDVGGLQLTASVTLLSGLQDSVGELLTYPYGCAEQTASRLLPLAALLELAARPDLGLPDARSQVQRGVQRLASMQTAEGGLAYWPGGAVPHPFATAWATWVLHLVEEAGFPVPSSLLKGMIGYLEREVQALGQAGLLGSGQVQADLRAATAAFVLAELGSPPPPELVSGLWARRSELPLFARALLMMTLHRLDAADPRLDAARREVLAAVDEQPATARTFERAAWWWGDMFHSSARSDAMVLLALLRAAPEHALVPKLARGLMEQRRGGAWRNTQENAWALVALAAYARARESVEPRLDARLWIEDTPALSARFEGFTQEVQVKEVPMEQLLALRRGQEGDAGSPLGVTLQRHGAGRLYWRLGFSYAVEGRGLPARSRGLTVARSLRRRDGSALAPGTALQTGEVVAMDVEVTSSGHAQWVAANIPLPPGLEPIDEALGSGHAASTFTRRDTRRVSHRELHPERVLLFADDLPASSPMTTTVFLRATTPGRYALPPATAEAMYEPEVFGRSAGQEVVVAER